VAWDAVTSSLAAIGELFASVVYPISDGIGPQYDRGYTPSMRMAVSIPDDLFRAAERAAKRLGLSRSELVQRALAAFLERNGDTLVTDALSEVYKNEARGSVDPVLDHLQRSSLPREKW
jgi:predicted transcriptional regulator